MDEVAGDMPLALAVFDVQITNNDRRPEALWAGVGLRLKLSFGG